MVTARVFQSGNGQAIDLAEEFRFDAGPAEIFGNGDEVVLPQRQQQGSAVKIFDVLASFPSDFMAEGRDDPLPQEREIF